MPGGFVVERLRTRFSSLQARITAIAMVPAIALALLVGGLSISMRESDLESGLRERGMLLARQLASAADYGVFSGNRAALQTLAESVASERAAFAVRILDRDGQVLASVGEAPAAALAVLARERGDTVPHDDWLAFREPIRSPRIPLDDLDAADPADGSRLRPVDDAPADPARARTAGKAGANTATTRITDETPAAGAAKQVATDIERRGAAGTAVVLLSTTEIRDEERRFAFTVVGMLAVVLLITGLVARRMSRRLSRPVVEAAQAAERIGRGEAGVRVTPSTIGVLDLLGRGLNDMAMRLERSKQDLEQRVQEATQLLVEKKEEAENANRAKSRFLAAASHDLRQPMHALGMFVATLSQQPSSAVQRQLISQIDRAVGAMGDLLDSLLDISRLDAGVIETRIAVLPLRPVLERIASEFGAIAQAKGLELVVRKTALWVRSDRILLERILVNLLSNAVRYTDHGRILIAARACGPDRGQVRIDVRDSGPGIPEEAREAIFQEFVQLGNPERDRSKGLGLGLAIVKRLVSLLDHRLELRSAQGAGSTFSVILPRVSAEQAARAEAAAARMSAALQVAANARAGGARRIPGGAPPGIPGAAQPRARARRADGHGPNLPTAPGTIPVPPDAATDRSAAPPLLADADAAGEPAGADARTQPRADEPSLAEAITRPFAGRRILVIDDDPLVRDGLSMMLKSWGALVAVSAGQPTLPQQLAKAERPDLILCDLRLGHHQDGVQMLEAIRSALGGVLPAVVITGDTDPERVALAGRDGDPVLHKPVRPAQLRALLHGLLRRPAEDPGSTGPADAD